MAIRTVISGLGTYTPEREIPIAKRERTHKGKALPIGRITGIESLYVAAEGEYAIDLAEKAARACLSSSEFEASDLDLLLSCGICRYDLPQNGHVFEPSTAVRLARRLRAKAAHAFDISNACAGLFTGIYVVDAFIRSGQARHGLVVSGEFISHMAETALREIKGLFDSRVACLTLGDGGAAVLLSGSEGGRGGFAAMSLYSLPQQSHLCTAKPTEQSHNGAIMHTESAEIARLMIDELVAHVPPFLAAHGDTVDRVIPHQTSKRSIDQAISAVNRKLGAARFETEQVLVSVQHRGNTASTSHMLALQDGIDAGRVAEGDTVLFSVNASGLVVGSFVHEFTALPGKCELSASPRLTAQKCAARVIGHAISPSNPCESHLESFAPVIRQALASAGSKLDEIDLMIYAGVYREGFVMEPCIAALVAHSAGVGCRHSREFLCFDVFAGENGLLHALKIAEAAMHAHGKRKALVVCGDVDPNFGSSFAPPLGIVQSAGAFVLGPSEGAGFGGFQVRFAASDLLRHTKQGQGETYIVSRGTPAESAELQSSLAVVASECLSEARDRGLEVNRAALAGVGQADADGVLHGCGFAGDIVARERPFQAMTGGLAQALCSGREQTSPCTLHRNGGETESSTLGHLLLAGVSATGEVAAMLVEV